MFGFLKQKLTDFSKKLAQTAQKEEKAGEETLPKEENKTEKKSEEHKKQEKNLPEKKTEEKTKTQNKTEEKKEAAQKIAKDENKPKEISPAQTTQAKTETQEAKKEQKKGIFKRLFGGKKKAEEKTEENKTEEKRKKTNEEKAAEMEAKMFREIQNELKEEVGEEKQRELIEEAEEEQEQKKPSAAEKKEEEKSLKKEEKMLNEAKKEETILQKAIQKDTNEKIAQSITEENTETKEKTIAKENPEEEPEEPEENTTGIEEIAQEVREKPRDIRIKTLEEEKRELKAHVGVGGKVKGLLFGGVEITEGQINDLLWELELSLIESDVEQDAAKELIKQIKERLLGKKVSPKGLDEYLKEQIKEILTEMMKTEEINLLNETQKKKKEGKPLIILMLGPNGAGKTTSIAKLVHYFKKHKLTSIVAAGDTFRAGAIDQIEEHAKRLGVRVIKQQYGADPAAVSFDAIKAAEAGKIDVVIIDSAGRQETNKNLMEELRKIERVAKPDLRLYVGEAYVGQTLLEQVTEFEEMIGIDGFILTKIDTDAKGGTAISLLYKMKKPIVFVGTGQGYDDFKEFTPEFVLERII